MKPEAKRVAEVARANPAASRSSAPGATTSVACPICEKTFPNERVLAVHIDDWHKVPASGHTSTHRAEAHKIDIRSDLMSRSLSPPHRPQAEDEYAHPQ